MLYHMLRSQFLCINHIFVQRVTEAIYAIFRAGLSKAKEVMAMPAAKGISVLERGRRPTQPAIRLLNPPFTPHSRETIKYMIRIILVLNPL